MPDPLNLYNFFGQSVNDTTGQQSLVLASSGVGPNHSEETSVVNRHGTLALASSGVEPNHSEGTNFVNRHGAININISLNSANNPSSQNQTTQRLGQVGLHQNVVVSSLRRSSLTISCGNRAHSTNDPPMQPQNTVNINIAIRNNSSININLPNNNAPSRLRINNTSAHASPGVELVRKNFFNIAPSNFKQPFPTLASIQESIRENILDISESTQLIACQRKGIANSSVHQMQSSNPCQSIDFEHHSSSQSKSNFSFCHLLRRFMPPLPSNSNMNLEKGKEINFDDGNDTFQTSFPTWYGSRFAEQHGTAQVSYPNTNITYLLTSPLQAISKVPFKNDFMTLAQSNLANTTRPNHGTNQGLQARRRRRSSVRRKSHPYIKYGPYTCPDCHDTFESQHCFAAHVQTHYKGESLAKRKKRREAKIRNRDLHIATSPSGITIVPGSLQVEENLEAASNNNWQNATRTNQGQGFSAVRIKEEIKTD